ncbi:MAG: hypothetical protein ACFCUT_01490 [Kiloniellaceae bacterium]
MTDLSSEAPVPFDAGADDAIANQLLTQPEVRHSELVIRIDRYLRAAGASDTALLSRLTAATARDLLARGVSAEPAWAEIIAAVDRSLAGELSADGAGSALPTPRGRVALRLAVADRAAGARAVGAEWGTPPRQHRGMRAQNLSLWRPSAKSLLRLQVSRPLLGLAACLCWLAVVVVP